MKERLIGINPATPGTGTHDPSAVLFEDGELVFGAEEERFNRRKHSMRTFPSQSVRACLDACEVELSDIDKVLVSWKPEEKAKRDFRLATKYSGFQRKAYHVLESLKNYKMNTLGNKLSELGTPVPPIETYNHHRCHAASAFAPSGFDEALVVTLDGRGERESTVVWKADGSGLERIRTYEYPNSLGAFYGTITAYLGYRVHNGEGKIMGLAPYGSHNQEIADKLLSVIEPGVDYDVSALNYHGDEAIPNLEALFDRPKKLEGGEFSDWEMDLASTAQRFLERTVADIVETYCREYGIGQVGLAGGVALNCKANKRILELDAVDDLFVQPVAHDAGSAIGAAVLEAGITEVDEMCTVYWGPEYSKSHIQDLLQQCKLGYSEPDDLERTVAERLAQGDLVGWFQGRTEMGPRALGNRSILADPRTVESRERLNRFVKHREEWRPFAPSMLEEAADEYLVDAEPAPYMIKSFDVVEGKAEEIPAVIHRGDRTTRPQTVREDQNPRYYRLLEEFQSVTGVPVLLNTSFNDSGEPIVNTPSEAIRDFYAMGLDLLVLGDLVLEKTGRDRSVLEATDLNVVDEALSNTM